MLSTPPREKIGMKWLFLFLLLFLFTSAASLQAADPERPGTLESDDRQECR
jgi:hypothetical protein